MAGTVFLLLAGSSYLIGQSGSQIAETEKKQLESANYLLDQYPDSAFRYFRELLDFFTGSGDSLSIINCHIGLSDVYKTRGQYSDAYDHLWDALLLAEDLKSTRMLIDIYLDLASLYGILGKHEESIDHMNLALSLTQELIRTHESNEKTLISIYYALAVQHRKAANLSLALEYLDSSMHVSQTQQIGYDNMAFINAERGVIYTLLDRLEDAENHLLGAKKVFEESDAHFLVMIYAFLGDLYIRKADIDKALFYFRNSLNSIDRFNAHTDMRPEVLTRLSELYEKSDNLGLAYRHLEEANELTDSLFSATNDNNAGLFQIRNRYRETIREQDEYIKEQQSIIERKNLVQSRLRILVGSVVLAVLGLAVVMRMRYKLRKTGQEKEQLALQARYEREKSEAVLDIKSRELTSGTLQMIEKDRTIEELLQELRRVSPSSYKPMKTRILRGSKNMWEQFNTRFTEVNAHFYENLRKRHPGLTPTEQKHCALIKLNFESKEMAQLLNISLNSVHISRHRIRKKIGLKREESLGNYISEI